MTSDGCAWVKPIYPSRHDTLTDETARQILAHDNTWERLCKRSGVN